MTHINEPRPGETPYPIEPKVKVSAIAQYFAGLVLVAVASGVTDGNLLNELPDWATALLAPVLPVIVGMLAAYKSRHQYRAAEVAAPHPPQ